MNILPLSIPNTTKLSKSAVSEIEKIDWMPGSAVLIQAAIVPSDKPLKALTCELSWTKSLKPSRFKFPLPIGFDDPGLSIEAPFVSVPLWEFPELSVAFESSVQ
ncbi:MAG: hypothetical protein AB2821_17445 [Candidatus Thiodiazotropha endolucinida]